MEDIKDIQFVLTKNTVSYKKTNNDSVEKKNYGIVNKNNERITFILNNVFIPFGFEIYNKNEILNIELKHKQNNDHHNIYVFLLNLEKNIKNAIKSNFFVNNDIKSKIFHSTLKEKDNNVLVRSYSFGKKEIFKKINTKKFPTNDIKGKRVNVEIEIRTLWITCEEYGILYNIKNIEVLN